MRRLSLHAGSLVLAAAMMVAPIVVSRGSHTTNVYDEAHGQDHRCDDHEEPVYRGYLSDNHRNYKLFNQLSKEDQKSY